MQPPYPRQQGHRPCTLPAMEEIYCTNFFPHETSGNGKRAHGRSENVEKSRSGKYTFLPVFSHFPRMQQHPVGGVSHRPARGWLCHTRFAKFHSFFCKGVSACSSAAPNSQKCNLPLQREFCVAAVPQPARKTTILISEGVSACSCGAPNSQSYNRSFAKMCVHVTLFHRETV